MRFDEKTGKWHVEWVTGKVLWPTLEHVPDDFVMTPEIAKRLAEAERNMVTATRQPGGCVLFQVNNVRKDKGAL